MGWSDIGEIIKAIAPVFTAGAACFGAYIGWRGLMRWRVETIGKRKAELAEEVLADFYEASEIIKSSREVGGGSSTRYIAPDETENETRELNAILMPEQRLEMKQEFFAQLKARQYRFVAVFGTEAGKPYDELFEIRKKINIATHMLNGTVSQSNRNEEQNKQWRSIIFRQVDGPDDIDQNLDRVIENIEKFCRPAIQQVAK